MHENQAELGGFSDARKHLPALIPYLKSYRKGLLVGIGCVFITTATGNVLPLLVSKSMNHITALVENKTTNLENHLGWFFLAILGIALFSAVFRFLQRYILIGISRKIELDLRNDLFAQLLRMPPAFFQKMTTGDIVARSTNDMNQVRSMLGPGLMYPVNSVLTMVFALAGMIYLSPLLTLVALFPPIVMAFGTNRFAKILHDRFMVVQEQYSKISSRVQENLTGIRVIKAYCREEGEVEELKKLNRDYLVKNLRYFRSMGTLFPFFGFSQNLGRLVVLTVGGYLMLQPGSRFQIGDFAGFLIYLSLLQFPMISIGWVINVIQRGVASLARINEIMDAVPEIRDPDQPLPCGPTHGEIEFRGVTFGYLEGRPVLKGIDLRIPAGTCVGIIGATGSGKSTLAQLIPRFYDPQQGEVRIDGNHIQDYRLADLRRTIGYVSQDHFIFSSTVGKNISFGLSHEDLAEEEVIEEASRLAAFHDNVLELPQGYDTMVGERGITLSGGQRQRAAIARALAINPVILILDDALSAVDTDTEEKILSGLRRVLEGRTTLFISHRVSTVQDADLILVLEDGMIREQGTHESLLALNGLYAQLYQHQLLEEQLKELSA